MCFLHLGDPSKVARGDRIAEFFERIDDRGELRRSDGRCGPLEEVIRGLELTSDPFRDPCDPVVRLISQIVGELIYRLIPQELDVLVPVEELGVGIRDKGERGGARSPTSGRRLASTRRRWPASHC